MAILSRSPATEVFRGYAGEDGQEGARVIGATIGDIHLLNLYVVNGREVGHPKFDDKLAWMAGLADFVAGRYDPGHKVILTGDFNITFDDRDVYDPERWREKIHCSTPERQALARLMEPGYADAFRRFHQDSGHYTWWNYRTRSFEANQGLRLDHLLMSGPALSTCTDVTIDAEERGRARPSDHAPVLATLL